VKHSLIWTFGDDSWNFVVVLEEDQAIFLRKWLIAVILVIGGFQLLKSTPSVDLLLVDCRGSSGRHRRPLMMPESAVML
jgi:hypothetical protein